jgi:hypothetical protein
MAWMCMGCAAAFGLQVQPLKSSCEVVQANPTPPPAASSNRLPQSQVVQGSRDILWVWLGSPTRRYPHGALGSGAHAASLHVLVAAQGGGTQELVYTLPVHRVFEDRVPRLVDLDGDGRDEILLVEADALKGAALVVFGVAHQSTGSQPAAIAPPALVEIARGPHAGSTFRWLNPVGVADFDGDGKLDIASVITPHIGGILTLYAFRPPHLVAFASMMDVSNHRMGELEQQLAVIVMKAGQRPTVILPDMALTSLQGLRWDAPGAWKESATPKPLPARVQRLSPLAGGACLHLVDGSWWRVELTP